MCSKKLTPLLLGELAEKALIDEVKATPKPGLVDMENSGAHSDMNIYTFIVSAKSLKPFFIRFAEMGYLNASLPENEVFAKARVVGLEAEKAMFGATGGINTHKGMIFSIGLICLAAGRLLKKGEPLNADTIGNSVALHVNGICQSDYTGLDTKNTLTNGEKVYIKYGIKGPRGEAESGFRTVREVSYPTLKKYLKSSEDQNEALVRTLLYMMSVLDDTNVLKRGGVEGAVFVKEKSKELVNASMKSIRCFDRTLIEKNISPGGCADLLAATWFIYQIENYN